jgi:hypothetical protein
MPIYNQVQTETITNGGGTISLACGNSTTTRYVFSGTATLAANWVIQPSGTPFQGMEFDIRWQSACTIGANSVTIFGVALTADQALNDLIITCYYNGSAWDVDIQQDVVEDIFEFGTGGNASVILANGGTSTASGSGAVNMGVNNTVSGDNSFSAGISNTASNQDSTAIGNTNTASGLASVALGNGNVASGDYCFASGILVDATGTASTAEGNGTLASGSNSHAGGFLSVSSRYAQFSRASGKHDDTNVSDYSQFSKLTLFEQSTDATPTILCLDGIGGAHFLTIPTNSIAYFRGEVVAVQQGGSAGSVGDTASWHFNGCIKNISGTTSLVDTVRYQDNTGAWGAAAQRTQDAGAAAWTLVPTATNATDTLDITATGEVNKTIYWLCNIELTEIRYTP